MLGKIEGKRRGGQQRMKLLDSITNSMDMKSHGVNLNLTQGKGRTIQQNRIKGTGTGKKALLSICLLLMGSQRVGHN